MFKGYACVCGNKASYCDKSIGGCIFIFADCGGECIADECKELFVDSLDLDGEYIRGGFIGLGVEKGCFEISGRLFGRLINKC
jgi:hypothetical protein